MRHHADLHGDENCHVETVEAERPRPHGASSEAPGEHALQGDESEGWPGSCKRAQHQVDLSQRAGTAVSKKRKLPSGSGGSCEAKRRPAQFPSRKARTCGFTCRREATGEAAHGGQSGFRKDAAPSAAKEGEGGGAIFRPRIVTERGFDVLPTGGATGPWVGIQVDRPWGHKGRSAHRTQRGNPGSFALQCDFLFPTFVFKRDYTLGRRPAAVTWCITASGSNDINS
jgi:hypothetical protein